MYLAILKNPSNIYPWLKWKVVLRNESSIIMMLNDRRYADLSDARAFAKYLAKELKIKTNLSV